MDWTIGTCGVRKEFEDETNIISLFETKTGLEIIIGHGEETMLGKEEDIFAKGKYFSLNKTCQDI